MTSTSDARHRPDHACSSTSTATSTPPRSDVQAAINAAGGQLPQNLPSPPTYRKVNPADSPILILAVTSDTLPLTEVDDYADNVLAQQISQIAGVGQVIIGGEQKPAIRVQVDPAKLAATGLSLEDVRGVLANATVNAPKGSDRRRRAELHHLRQRPARQRRAWNDVIVAYRNGAPVRVRDIGRAVDGPGGRQAWRRWANGKRGDASWSSSSSRAPTSSRPSTASRPRCRACRPPCRPAIKVDIIERPHADHPRLGRGRAVHAGAHDRPGRAGDLRCSCATCWATIIPSVAVPLVAASAPAR